jgi:hypothetical protein
MKTILTALLCVGFFSIQAITYTTTNAINSEPLDWNDADSWVGGVVPTLGNFSNHVVNINHDITRTGDLSVVTSSFTIADGVTFTVDGNFFDSFNGGSYNSGSSSVWNITGNLDISSDATFQTGNGTVNVGGDYDVEGHNVTTVVDGVLNVAGTIKKGTGSSKLTGSGVVTWGVLEVGGGSTIGSSSQCPNSGFDLTDSGVDLTTCAVVLPVEFVSFRAKCTEEGVLINWVTATETDNDFFEIQKAVGSFEFVTIDEIDGHGTAKTASYYSYLDSQKNSDLTVYYRLRQVDFNGDYEFSRVIVSQCEMLDKSFSVYPTVSSGEYTVSFNEVNEFILIQVINELGQVVKVVNYTNTDKTSTFQFDLNGHSSGVYYAKVLLNNHYEVAKLIKR